MEQILFSRAYRVEPCKRIMGCVKTGKEGCGKFHIYTYSSRSARFPLAQGEGFTGAVTIRHKLSGSQLVALDAAVAEGTVLEDGERGARASISEALTYVEGIFMSLHTDDAPDLDVLIGEPDISIETEESDDDPIIVVIVDGDEADLPIPIAAAEPPPARRRSAQPPVSVSGEIGPRN